jgi:hypothetical protein
MNAISTRRVPMAAIAAPFVAFGVYVAWLVVPIVIREVVPEVIRAAVNN